MALADTIQQINRVEQRWGGFCAALRENPISDRTQFSYSACWEQFYEAYEPANGEAPDIEFAHALVLSGVAIRQVAAELPNGRDLVRAAAEAMADWEDNYCGTPPRPVPTLALAASLAVFADSLPAGDLRSAVQEEASRIAQNAFEASGTGRAGIRSARC